MKYEVKLDEFTGDYLVERDGTIMATGMNKSTAEWIAESFNKMLIEENINGNS